MYLSSITLQKVSSRRLNSSSFEDQIARMAVRVNNWSRFGWRLEKNEHFVTNVGTDYQYMVVLSLSCNSYAKPEEVSSQLSKIANDIVFSSKTYHWDLHSISPLNKNGETIVNPTAESEEVITLQSPNVISNVPNINPNVVNVVEPVDLNPDIDLGPQGNWFAHIYERNAQVSIVLSAYEAAKASNFKHRSHTVLFGEPGCGKSLILESFVNMVGSENVMKFDGPSTTKAGLENFLLGGMDDPDMGPTPKIMIFEEIEKSAPDVTKVLLGILDTRGEIRKTTGTDGQLSKPVKVLCFATVNNKEKFDQLFSGSVASRFAHHVYCPRPSRSCLSAILRREIQKMDNGSEDWIDPTLDYVLGELNCTDPRKHISVCLSGRDRLLTGTYQKALRAVDPKNHLRR